MKKEDINTSIGQLETGGSKKQKWVNLPPLYHKYLKDIEGELPVPCTSALIYGASGSGKTYHALLMAKSKKGKISPAGIYVAPSILFLPADHFFNNCNSVDNKVSYILKLVTTYDVIILDDLSFSNFTAAKTENLYILVDAVYTRGTDLIITTVYFPDVFEQIDERIFNRTRHYQKIRKGQQ